MSFESRNILEKGTKIKDVKSLIELLGYKFINTWSSESVGKVNDYSWFEHNDYKSTSGVELAIYTSENHIKVYTRTSISRSYYDLEQQNKTIKLLKKHFGGSFVTDFGKGRYLIDDITPKEPSDSGCSLAYNNFGMNLIRAKIYYDSRDFGERNNEPSGIFWIDRVNPKLLSNNFILVFLISIFEDYWKSTYIVLLKYSENKEAILKNGRISAERLVQISNNLLTVEEGFVESMSFAKISNTCKHFKLIDNKLDFAGLLKKPIRRGKKSLFDSLEEMTDLRNKIVHEASSAIILDEKYIRSSFKVLQTSIDLCYQALTKNRNWIYNKNWSAGKI